MSTGTIYCLENLVTGKMYIGQTIDYNRRIYDYSRGYGHGFIGSSIAKHGWENFAVMQVETIPVEDLDTAEQFWIEFLNCRAPNGYNLEAGGRHGSISEITRQLLSERAIENWQNPEYRENRARQHRKTMQDERLRQQTSNTITELWQDPEYRAMHEAARQDPEYRRNIGDKARQRWADPDYKRWVVYAAKIGRAENKLDRQTTAGQTFLTDMSIPDKEDNDDG